MPKLSVIFHKRDGPTVTPIPIDDAFRLMVLGYIPQWNVPIVDLKNREIFLNATLVKPE